MSTASASGSPDVAPIIGWLADGAPSTPDPAELFGVFCGRICDAGIPLWRVGLFVRTLHPEVFGRNFIWRPDKPVELGFVDFDVQESAQFLNSPMRPLFFDGVDVRHHVDEATANAFPFLEDMRAEGVTDYYAAPLHFTDGTRHVTSWTTRQPGGFTDAQLDALRRLMPPLTRIVETIVQRRIAQTLLDTYVGSRAGTRILAGQIRRGHTETMHAAIWLSDLRGFTALSDRLPAESVVRVLNQYFDCQVPAILKHGGEVLKFMGDGLLAVFPIAADEGDIGEVCKRVLQAALESRASVETLQCDTETESVGRLRFGVALHVGRILYGNIGGGNRLDFTCIGPAVNLAARLEKIAGKLGRTVVASQMFADLCETDWTDLGEFPIAGFAKAERVYGLADEEPLGI
jgi:adenylate cyclase